MIDHVGLSCTDLAASATFYDEVLAVLGFSRQLDVGPAIGYGADREAPFWISRWPGGGPPREVHVAFAATSRAQVEDFYARAIAAGATSLHAPREWPEYHAGYYGAFVRGPDGNNVEAVWHGEGNG